MSDAVLKSIGKQKLKSRDGGHSTPSSSGSYRPETVTPSPSFGEEYSAADSRGHFDQQNMTPMAYEEGAYEPPTAPPTSPNFEMRGQGPFNAVLPSATMDPEVSSLFSGGQRLVGEQSLRPYEPRWDMQSSRAMNPPPAPALAPQESPWWERMLFGAPSDMQRRLMANQPNQPTSEYGAPGGLVGPPAPWNWPSDDRGSVVPGDPSPFAQKMARMVGGADVPMTTASTQPPAWEAPLRSYIKDRVASHDPAAAGTYFPRLSQEDAGHLMMDVPSLNRNVSYPGAEMAFSGGQAELHPQRPSGTGAIIRKPPAGGFLGDPQLQAQQSDIMGDHNARLLGLTSTPPGLSVQQANQAIQLQDQETLRNATERLFYGTSLAPLLPAALPLAHRAAQGGFGLAKGVLGKVLGKGQTPEPQIPLPRSNAIASADEALTQVPASYEPLPHQSGRVFPGDRAPTLLDDAPAALEPDNIATQVMKSYEPQPHQPGKVFPGNRAPTEPWLDHPTEPYKQLSGFQDARARFLQPNMLPDTDIRPNWMEGRMALRRAAAERARAGVQSPANLPEITPEPQLGTGVMSQPSPSPWKSAGGWLPEEISAPHNQPWMWPSKPLAYHPRDRSAFHPGSVPAPFQNRNFLPRAADLSDHSRARNPAWEGNVPRRSVDSHIDDEISWLNRQPVGSEGHIPSPSNVINLPKDRLGTPHDWWGELNNQLGPPRGMTPPPRGTTVDMRPPAQEANMSWLDREPALSAALDDEISWLNRQGGSLTWNGSPQPRWPSESLSREVTDVSPYPPDIAQRIEQMGLDAQFERSVRELQRDIRESAERELYRALPQGYSAGPRGTTGVFPSTPPAGSNIPDIRGPLAAMALSQLRGDTPAEATGLQLPPPPPPGPGFENLEPGAWMSDSNFPLTPHQRLMMDHESALFSKERREALASRPWLWDMRNDQF